MSWRNNHYAERPASKNKGARIAWDVLTAQAARMEPPRRIEMLWFAPEMDDGVWNARLDGGTDDYIEMDVLEVADRKNNPHKYANSKASA